MTDSIVSDVDIAVLGGGMSGLALACELDQRNAQSGKAPRNCLVLEPRASYERDKTWCYWRHQPGLFDRAITHSWHRWEVRNAGRSCISSSALTPYARVDSAHYYELATANLARSNTVGLQMNVAAEAVQKSGNRVRVETTEGALLADRVIDTRPRPIPKGTLLQHFYGWEIETDKDVFDPTTVTLMDFSDGNSCGVHFYYVLPFSSRNALVETTHFSLALKSAEQYQAELDRYLRHRFGLSHWRVKRLEQGVLPMRKRRQPNAVDSETGTLAFGLHSDTVKPSTGYCFPHAQEQAKSIADWLELARGATPPRARSRVSTWFDGVFVSFLEHQASAAPEVFFNLFKQVPPESLVAFLSDRAGFIDYARVVLALPKWMMVREAIRYVAQR